MFFREIPWSLEQAAQADVPTPFQAFRKVIAPLAAPGMFTAAILCLHLRLERLPLRDLADVDEPRLPGPRLAIVFFQGTTQFQQPTGQIAAAAVVITIPVVIAVLIFQKRIVSGLTSGAVRDKEQDPPLMAEIEIEHVNHRVFPDGTEAVKDVTLDARRRRVRDPRGTVGFRQVDDAAT